MVRPGGTRRLLAGSVEQPRIISKNIISNNVSQIDERKTIYLSPSLTGASPRSHKDSAAAAKPNN